MHLGGLNKGMGLARTRTILFRMGRRMVVDFECVSYVDDAGLIANYQKLFGVTASHEDSSNISTQSKKCKQ